MFKKMRRIAKIKLAYSTSSRMLGLKISYDVLYHQFFWQFQSNGLMDSYLVNELFMNLKIKGWIETSETLRAKWLKRKLFILIDHFFEIGFFSSEHELLRIRIVSPLFSQIKTPMPNKRRFDNNLRRHISFMS